jgi:hypothetical protein
VFLSFPDVNRQFAQDIESGVKRPLKNADSYAEGHETGVGLIRGERSGSLIDRIVDPRFLIEHQAIAESELGENVLGSARISL